MLHANHPPMEDWDGDVPVRGLHRAETVQLLYGSLHFDTVILSTDIKIFGRMVHRTFTEISCMY